jgi:EAL domain-containing protein (putative c-di-GMP-specific phosphodiesterase class I)
MIAPGDFIPLAEDTGLIIPLGEWVLRAACAAAADWPRHIRVCVNLSPVQFTRGGLVDLVETALGAHRLAPERLELEITESVLINDKEAALRILTKLKQIGVFIAMDDFGTGYSSLAYLNAFPFDKIKIDRAFIADLGRDDKSSAIVRSVLGLGANLAMTTTAEGVENLEQVAFLRDEGCQQVQGYYFGRPMQPEEVNEFLLASVPRDPRSRSGSAA